MALYNVKLAGIDGDVLWLKRGRAVVNQDVATVYSSPSAARVAAEQFLVKASGVRLSFDVVRVFSFRGGHVSEL